MSLHEADRRIKAPMLPADVRMQRIANGKRLGLQLAAREPADVQHQRNDVDFLDGGGLVGVARIQRHVDLEGVHRRGDLQTNRARCFLIELGERFDRFFDGARSCGHAHGKIVHADLNRPSRHAMGLVSKGEDDAQDQRQMLRARNLAARVVRIEVDAGVAQDRLEIQAGLDCAGAMPADPVPGYAGVCGNELVRFHAGRLADRPAQRKRAYSLGHSRHAATYAGFRQRHAQVVPRFGGGALEKFA